MGRHRIRRVKAWAWRWKPTLLLGGAAAVLFLINAKRAQGAEIATAQDTGLPVNPDTGLPIQTGTAHIPELPGTLAPTSVEITDAASEWNSLNPGPGLSSGWINFPSGSQASAAVFQIRYDVYGSPYVQWAGQTYILTGPDSSGNYSATRVMM